MRNYLCIPLFMLTFALYAQEQKITTIILVRHAEKAMESTNDPNLAAEGQERAKRLASLLKETNLTAIYSTDFKRTRQTVEPVAQLKSIAVQLYDPAKPEFLDNILSQHRGGTVLIAGHSNSTPKLANLLLGSDKLQPFVDTDYDNVLIVSVVEKGKVATLTWLSY